MEIKGTLENGIINVILKGRLDMANAMTAEQYFLKYAESGKDFVLDFSGVEFIASAGIRALLTLYRTVSEKNGSVTIRNAQMQFFTIGDLAAFFSAYSPSSRLPPAKQAISCSCSGSGQMRCSSRHTPSNIGL